MLHQLRKGCTNHREIRSVLYFLLILTAWVHADSLSRTLNVVSSNTEEKMVSFLVGVEGINK